MPDGAVLAVLDGVLERVTFVNPETGYTIARIAPVKREGELGGGAELVTAVGPLLGAQVGEFLRLRGRWSSHPKYGRQFEVHSYTAVLPATVAGIQRYLGSGLIKGIGPVMAQRTVAHFGVDIMHVIEDSPGRLIEVDGLGPKRTALIAAAWAEQKAIKEVMIFLQGVGVSTSLAVRIYKKYGDASVSVVRSEPYRLAADVWGIGFKTADTIAASVGIARDSPERIKAGLAYTLSEAADDGHCYLPQPNLIADAAKILDVSAELITPCLGELAAAEGVVREAVPAASGPAGAGPTGAGAAPQVLAVYLPPFYQAERALAAALLRLLAAGRDRLPGFASVFEDFFWFSCEDGEETAGLVANIVARRIPARFGLDPRRDVQVLCPMHRGPAGTGNLNLLLQEALTPFREGSPERRYGGRVFRIGDKVTQLRNNYDKGAAGIFNGAVGVVTGSAFRGVPDVTYNGDVFNGVLAAWSESGLGAGLFFTFGGTSAGTPQWSGITALADQAAGHRLCFLNPSLYALARTPLYYIVFHDVLIGNNSWDVSGITGYSAHPRWDPASGLGSPNAAVLIKFLSL